MKKLSINITKAQLVSFGVELEDGKPEVNVTIALLTDGGKVVTTYTISTAEWRSEKFDLPLTAMPLIGDLARILEGSAVRHAQEGQLALAPADEEKAPIYDTEDHETEEAPINIDSLDLADA